MCVNIGPVKKDCCNNMSSETQNTVGYRRWVVPVVLCVSLYIAFIDRMNLSLAMPQLAAQYGWSTEEIGGKGGLLLGAFYIAYGISNLLLSAFAARMGPRRSLMTLVFLFSIFTMLGAPLSYSLALFIGTRVCLGLGEGVHFPMMNTVIKHWFPVNERSRANAIWVFGGTLAMITMPFILVPVISHFGWKTMLIGCGVLGMLVTIPLLYFFIFNTPREARWISAAETDYIEKNLEHDAPAPADWSFVKAPVFWLAVCGGILNNYCAYGVINWLPTYFVNQRGIDFSELWYAASLPYAAGVLAFLLFAYLGDRTNRRITLAGLGFLGATVSIFLAINAPNVPLAVLAFSWGTFCQTAFITQEFAIIQRILPVAIIGKATGIYNGTSMLLGAVGGVVLLGQIVSLTGSYDAGLYSVVTAAILGCAAMLLLSRFVKY